MTPVTRIGLSAHSSAMHPGPWKRGQRFPNTQARRHIAATRTT
jgi:hypothetical protein